MSATAQFSVFSKLLFERMEKDGFRKRSNSITQKIQGIYPVRLTLYTNKLKGEDAIRQTYIIGQSFPEIDRIIYYLRNEYFSSKWVTGRIWLCTLMPTVAKTTGLPNMVSPNGYTHRIDDNIDIHLLAEEVYSNLKSYAYPFLTKYQSPLDIFCGLVSCEPELKTWAVQGSDLFYLAFYLSNQEQEKAINFCKQKIFANRQDENYRTSITQEILGKVEDLKWSCDGKLLLPPIHAGTKLR